MSLPGLIDELEIGCLRPGRESNFCRRHRNRREHPRHCDQGEQESSSSVHIVSVASSGTAPSTLGAHALGTTASIVLTTSR